MQHAMSNDTVILAPLRSLSQRGGENCQRKSQGGGPQVPWRRPSQAQRRSHRAERRGVRSAPRDRKRDDPTYRQRVVGGMHDGARIKRLTATPPNSAQPNGTDVAGSSIERTSLVAPVLARRPCYDVRAARKRATSSCPRATALSMTVSPSESTANGSAPRVHSSSTTARWPPLAAVWRGVLSPELRKLADAPASSSHRTAARFPEAAAQ